MAVTLDVCLCLLCDSIDYFVKADAHCELRFLEKAIYVTIVIIIILCSHIILKVGSMGNLHLLIMVVLMSDDFI